MITYFENDLHHEYHFLLDGESSLKHHIRVEERPSIPAPSRKWNEYGDVLSRSGTMRKPMDAFSEVSFTINCNFVSDEYQFDNVWREIRGWLLSDASEKKFQNSYDLNWYKKISKIVVSDVDRILFNAGQFSITFTVDPYDYAISGDKWHSLEDVRLNHYYKCEPLWKITNNTSQKATCTITVNNKSFDVTDINAAETKYVDVERKLTYAVDTSNYYLRGGRYGQEEWLELQNGNNEITVTTGFSVSVMPRWRCV